MTGRNYDHPAAGVVDADNLPSFGNADQGSVLGELDRRHAARAAEHEARAVARRETQQQRALALLRGAPDPYPNEPSEAFRSTPGPIEEPELHTVAWTKWKNAQNPQGSAEYQREVAAYRAAQFRDLTSGRVRRGAKAPATRSRSSRRTRRGAGHSRSASPSRDGPGEPPGESDSDEEGESSAAAGVCAGCGAELLEPAPLCGLCLLERGETQPSSRACAICGADITHRRANAETCSPAHKKQLQRVRVKSRGGPLLTSAEPGCMDRERAVRLFLGGEEVRWLTTDEAMDALRKVPGLRLCNEHPMPVLYLASEGCVLCGLMFEDWLHGGGVGPLRRAA